MSHVSASATLPSLPPGAQRPGHDTGDRPAGHLLLHQVCSTGVRASYVVRLFMYFSTVEPIYIYIYFSTVEPIYFHIRCVARVYMQAMWSHVNQGVLLHTV